MTDILVCYTNFNALFGGRAKEGRRKSKGRAEEGRGKGGGRAEEGQRKGGGRQLKEG